MKRSYASAGTSKLTDAIYAAACRSEAAPDWGRVPADGGVWCSMATPALAGWHSAIGVTVGRSLTLRPNGTRIQRRRSRLRRGPWSVH
jgi:hypothetical protein